ncbi:hypothetical protein IT072_02395 [Leifsonia sp. ZF2019]|uniref:Gp19/Gp15/Gp42 family protein n=1 Tax=Leifsonia sp. ZF2019 TaxID=2781978 RepID=UPI001CBC9187|nr:Gp19/Gp15/Gp42 family protein [Leifsonia sp. ZF2019]UAJ78317.1 hypothetical protein IT072_13720 [Leifsonia sp. ZF2019]UAJ79947.1 hypothetical protein IT072_02395 [Leifsonia sp. ZF2019]
MTTFATPEDVANVWQPLTTSQEALAENLIEQASNKLRLKGRRRRRDIDVLYATDPLLANAIRDAVVNAVKRVLMNPEALRQYSETTGPFTESKTLDTSISAGGLYLAPGDLIDIFPGSSGIRSFRVKTRML